MLHTPTTLRNRLSAARRLWLFLDYDGTLAEFAPTPEYVDPAPEVIGLMTRLAHHPRIRVAVISGRRLEHVAKLVPVPGVLLAGTYGIELQTFQGQQINRLDFDAVRPVLNALKPRWAQLIAGRRGFYLEDKGWALALHARFAADQETAEVLAAAARAANLDVPWEQYRLMGGHKFLEVGPRLAHKGLTVSYLLENYAWPEALPLYVGDDDKDREAFGVVQARGGLVILVSSEIRDEQADYCLESPQAARRWLESLLV
jgi:trehalose 6-phosphate phosphatase